MPMFRNNILMLLLLFLLWLPEMLILYFFEALVSYLCPALFMVTCCLIYNAAFQRSEMASLEGFKFFEIVIEKSCSRQRLPDKFAKMLAGREPAGSGLRRLWDVLVVFDGEGHMYPGPGWEQFARAHELQLGHFLVFRYDGDAMCTVKMFDNTMCRMYYQHDDDASNGSSSEDDDEQSGDDEE
ncbi:hypothetical protein CFC21_077544 [Triticum aestivum]|uniref:TF-B3 domain-containing protein n=2 Tax=Triticum aestivum TaxID=4565 RepID=A0A3B6MQ42_WHEAT|nr:hypothetical protein CFC21_077544 [Triticum aestivum]